MITLERSYHPVVTPVSEAWASELESACAQACRMIAPAWPLDRSIAVNPHWPRIGMPLRQVAARMAVLGDIRVFPSRESHWQAWQQGRITADDLSEALGLMRHDLPAQLNMEVCLQSLHQPSSVKQLPLLIDVLDNDLDRHSRLSWRQAVTHQVSQTCAAYFDAHQADWHPDRSQGLYAFWRDTLQHDHGIGVLMGLPQLGRVLQALPPTRQDAEQWVMQRLGLPPEVWADYLESVLLTVNGWASWCAYLGWEAQLQGKADEHLRDLLAIRLAWGALLLESRKNADPSQAFTSLQKTWQQASEVIRQAESAFLIDEVWLNALEIGYQRSLVQRLGFAAGTSSAEGPVEVQAAFCIDVRSERMRRALEAVWPSVQTIGFAGFFGLPIAYTPIGTPARRPQLPGLLLPAMEVTDCLDAKVQEGAGPTTVTTADLVQMRQDRFALSHQWHATSRWPSAAFSFVEAAGLSYLGKLWQWVRPFEQSRQRDDVDGVPARYRPVCRPRLQGLDLQAKVELTVRLMTAMGLKQRLAPLVLLVGHGSQSANNAHASGLDCGACCGQTGEVNARALAQLLNDLAVRQALVSKGLVIPESTWFLAALHNTTTDELEIFDEDLVPAAARTRLDQFITVWRQASDQVRRERASQLGLDPGISHQTLLALLRRRANDGAQTRPEWGLAGNAAFVIAPRARTQGVVLDGRTFLHDYDATQDADGSLLELLMTAPMLVTHWINWQYHASTCEPLRLGCGNKVLHNVVGGHIGVFEGNGGDLRVGLSQQSLHDGRRWVHEPLRLTVLIDAPAEAIERVIQKHLVVRQLVDNGWLHLWRYEGQKIKRYQRGSWLALNPQSP